MLRPQQVAAQIPNPLHPHCQCRALCPLQAAYRYLTIHAHPHMSSSILIYLRAHFPLQLVIWQGSVMHMPIVSKLCTLHVHHPTHLRPNQSAAMDEKFWPPPRSQTLAKTRTRILLELLHRLPLSCNHNQQFWPPPRSQTLPKT
jgi:hypothetical protein